MANNWSNFWIIFESCGKKVEIESLESCLNGQLHGNYLTKFYRPILSAHKLNLSPDPSQKCLNPLIYQLLTHVLLLLHFPPSLNLREISDLNLRIILSNIAKGYLSIIPFCMILIMLMIFITRILPNLVLDGLLIPTLRNTSNLSFRLLKLNLSPLSHPWRFLIELNTYIERLL